MKTEKQIRKKLEDIDKIMNKRATKIDKILNRPIYNRKIRDALENRLEVLEEDMRFYSAYRTALVYVLGE